MSSTNYVVPDRIISAIHAAMEQAQGNFVDAAVLMGWPTQKLRDAVRDNAMLRAAWVNPKGEELPTPEVTLLREEGRVIDTPESIAVPSSTPVLLSDQEVDRVIKEEDDKVGKGLKRLGLSPEEQETARSLAFFHRHHFKDSIDIAGGSMTKASVQMQTQLQCVSSRLEVVRAAIEDAGTMASEQRKALVDEERVLMQAYSEGLAILTRIYEISMKGAFVVATIRGGMKQAKSAGKPGFGSGNPL